MALALVLLVSFGLESFKTAGPSRVEANCTALVADLQSCSLGFSIPKQEITLVEVVSDRSRAGGLTMDFSSLKFGFISGSFIDEETSLSPSRSESAKAVCPGFFSCMDAFLAFSTGSLFVSIDQVAPALEIVLSPAAASESSILRRRAEDSPVTRIFSVNGAPKNDKILVASMATCRSEVPRAPACMATHPKSHSSLEDFV